MTNPKRPLTTSLVGLGILALSTLLLASPATAATYKIDAVHSSALFKVKHLNTANFYGMFKEVDGTIVYDSADPAKSSIEVSIAAESVDTRSENRDNHVKSPDFLNAKQFPKITFKSKSVKATGNGMEVVGDLTLLGVTKQVTAMVEKTGEGKHPRSGSDIIGFEAKFSVDRTAHDMNFMAGPLSETIEFTLAVEAAKQ